MPVEFPITLISIKSKNSRYEVPFTIHSVFDRDVLLRDKRNRTTTRRERSSTSGYFSQASFGDRERSDERILPGN